MAFERDLLFGYGKYHILFGEVLSLPYIVNLGEGASNYTYLLIPSFFILYVLYIGGDFKPTSRFLLLVPFSVSSQQFCYSDCMKNIDLKCLLL